MTQLPLSGQHCVEWKFAQISYIAHLLRLHGIATATLDTRRGEIASLRRAVCESIRLSGRKQPQTAEDIVLFLEAVFSLTAPCHLDSARQLAAHIQTALEQTITSLHDLPERAVADEASTRSVDEAIAYLSTSYEKNARRMTALLASADQEIAVLQEMLVKFAS
ncbi:hypothetical protein [Burkholderia glumae]|uniref:Uncharacterized protein n=1 Tax=Burkholderia glumae TaxID=337 RepID=A0AAP9XVE2_BURGL|nr:hypothetical protein [Burkholderia glumae]AJY64016.1 hypothetical protein KS03_3865 [Burkholderia glumae LMG 2196 = ATCC 33617]KHJ59512.1 hypothetical protein NCPPB3923_29000 [Burkholderia glumae]MCM2484425.1 hypothetical protein [Burkholderia glumae]MCM2494795.1 hypothetical protein [Burkholderia glumae]MCM2510117.1 hypothetical protein [Burkholderia glumae]